jgi:hypothetical protein
MTNYYPLIARAVEELGRSSGEARQSLYERARNAVAQLRSNPALLEADIAKECLALEEAIHKVEAETAGKSRTETRTEPQSRVDELRGHPLRAMSKREPQTTNERMIYLALRGQGKFATKSGGWAENRVFLERDSRRSRARQGRWILSACGHATGAAEPPRSYFSGD